MKAANKLRANWSKRERDIMLHHPLGIGTKSDAAYLASCHFDQGFIREMDERGYDIRTMRFEICPKKGHEKFASERQREDEQSRGGGQ